MAPTFGQRHTESGVGSLIRASIRAATNKRLSVGVAHHQPQQRHLSRVAALPATEPRMELKAQAMPLYADAPKPSKLFPKPTSGKPQDVSAQQTLFRGPALSVGTASSIGKQVSEDDARNNRSAREVLPKSRPTTASATLGGSHLKFGINEETGVAQSPMTPRRRLHAGQSGEVSPRHQSAEGSRRSSSWNVAESQPIDAAAATSRSEPPTTLPVAPGTNSGGCRLQQHKPTTARPQQMVIGGREEANLAVSCDGVYFAQYKGQPDTLVVYRSPEDRAANPERLNLDRRHLTVCPILKSEGRVRLLNYQNNYIEKIKNLDHLPNLIFLDLYNNCIDQLSSDLNYVPTLRVLMLGKNRIREISHLNKLTKLDVLDLHSNDISKIERLEELTELRVLNLAGNRLTELASLSSLHSLTELNVRRNQIERAKELESLAALQRVFLSNNRVASFDDVACMFKVRYLTELSMDGNPVAAADARAYRRRVVELVPTLRHLDLKRITDAERRAVALEVQREDERRRQAERRQLEEQETRRAQEMRQHAIEAAERDWQHRSPQRDDQHQSGVLPQRPGDKSCALLYHQGSSKLRFAESAPRFEGNTEAARPSSSPRPVSRRYQQAARAPATAADPTANPHPQVSVLEEPRKERSAANDELIFETVDAPSLPVAEQAFPIAKVSPRSPERRHSASIRKASSAVASGYYEVEVSKEERILKIYGEAFDCLDNPKVVATVTSLVCRFVSIDKAVERLRPHARALTKLRSAAFSDNAIHALRQVAGLLALLADVPALVELRIEANPVCSLKLLEPFVACLANQKLKFFNNHELQDEDRISARKRLGPICSALAITDNQHARPRHDEQKKGTSRAAARRAVQTAYVAAMEDHQFLCLFRRAWPKALGSLVAECIDKDSLVRHFFENEPLW